MDPRGAGIRTVMSAPAQDASPHQGPASQDVFAGVLRRAPPAQQLPFQYFQDRNKRWPFSTSAAGAELLQRLFADARKVVEIIDSTIQQQCAADDAARERVLSAGVELYARKPSIKNADVTWSQEEYRHIGLQREYVKFKSVQRFTETWACMERADARGVFASLASAAQQKREVRVASLGGGPGFELIAVREYFNEKYPGVTLDLVSLDVEESWRASAEGLGLRFIQWDMKDGGVAKACGGAIDFAIASYVFKMYMCENDVADWLARELADITACLVINRDEKLQQGCELVQSRGVDVLKLLRQDNGRDDRQLVFSRDRTFESWTSATPMSMTFPNVPYEEHKTSSDRGHRGGGGGAAGGWRRDGRSHGGAGRPSAPPRDPSRW